ncbi:MAG: diacylglycerol kinase family protein [Bacteroidetes bacterium]|nr:MAG: diacylglycerol kinase family protein [Bacteroidota bacterium]
MSNYIKRTLKSISWALSGISFAFRTQFNFRFHIISAVIVLLLSILLKLSALEWCIVLFCIASVITAELLNTAHEVNTDLLSPDINDTAKHVKDLAAAAVLVVAIVSAIIGCIIFLPKIFEIIFDSY